MATNSSVINIKHLLSEMTQEVRDRLAEAIELGKWADGTQLSKEQTEQCMRAVMLWDSQYGQDEDEPFRILRGGRLIDRVSKSTDDSNNNDTQSPNNSDNIDIKLQ